MPEYDLQRIAALLAEERSLTEISADLDGPPGPTPEEQVATTQRRQLQDARGALNAEAAPPGQEPDEDPVVRAFKLADQSGFQRGSDGRMQAFTEALLEAAQRGDARVVHQGTIDDATRRRWHEDARRRQVANRDASQMRHR